MIRWHCTRPQSKSIHKKLLILGPVKSGKSTLFHRLKLIHGNGFTQKERLQIKSQIYKYIIHSINKY